MKPGYKFKTAWHPLLVFTMEQFALGDRKISFEFSLNRLPQRIDIVVVEQENIPKQPARKLRSIFEQLGKHTLIEYKGVTDDLELADVTTLLSYAGQYMTMHGLFDPSEIHLLVIADHISPTFVEQIQRMDGSFGPVGGSGWWRGRLAGLPLRGVALRDTYKTSPSERLLYFFTREFLSDPQQMMRFNELDEEDIRVYRLLCQHVQQFRRNPMTMDLKDLDIATEHFDKPYLKLLEDLTPEHISRLTPEQLSRLTPEQLSRLTPEQRLAGIAPTQILSSLTPEQVLSGLTPEQLEALMALARDKQP